jgi:hypothetical protein
VWSRAQQHPQEKTWRTSKVLYKRRGFWAKRKKTWRHKRTQKEAAMPRTIGSMMTLPRERFFARLRSLTNPSAVKRRVPGHADERSTAQRADVQPSDVRRRRIRLFDCGTNEDDPAPTHPAILNSAAQ